MELIMAQLEQTNRRTRAQVEGEGGLEMGRGHGESIAEPRCLLEAH